MSRLSDTLLLVQLVGVPIVVWGAGWVLYEQGEIYPLMSPSLYGNLLFVLVGAVGLLNSRWFSRKFIAHSPSASVDLEPLEGRVNELEGDVDALSVKVSGLVAFSEIQKKREKGGKPHEH